MTYQPTAVGPLTLRQLRHPAVADGVAGILTHLEQRLTVLKPSTTIIDLIGELEHAATDQGFPNKVQGPGRVATVLVGWVVLQELGDEVYEQCSSWQGACRMIAWRRGYDGCQAVVAKAKEIASSGPTRVI